MIPNKSIVTMNKLVEARLFFEKVNPTYMRKSNEQKQAEAKARAEKWRALTPQQKLEHLDKKFGKGLGAGKERARIYAQYPELEPKAVIVETAKAPVRYEAPKKKVIPNGSRVILR